jgi:hypothetical protein
MLTVTGHGRNLKRALGRGVLMRNGRRTETCRSRCPGHYLSGAEDYLAVR